MVQNKWCRYTFFSHGTQTFRVRVFFFFVTPGIRKSGSRETETPLEELAVKDSINAIHKAQVRPPIPFRRASYRQPGYREHEQDPAGGGGGVESPAWRG